jgi:hypothetical protein
VFERWVSDLAYPLASNGQLDRDCADAENDRDEPKDLLGQPAALSQRSNLADHRDGMAAERAASRRATAGLGPNRR